MILHTSITGDGADSGLESSIILCLTLLGQFKVIFLFIRFFYDYKIYFINMSEMERRTLNSCGQ